MKRLFLAAILGSIVLLPVPSRALDTSSLVKDTTEAIGHSQACGMDWKPMLDRTLLVIEQRLSLLAEDVAVYRARIMREVARYKSAPCKQEIADLIRDTLRMNQRSYEIQGKL